MIPHHASCCGDSAFFGSDHIGRIVLRYVYIRPTYIYRLDLNLSLSIVTIHEVTFPLSLAIILSLRISLNTNALEMNYSL